MSGHGLAGAGAVGTRPRPGGRPSLAPRGPWHAAQVDETLVVLAGLMLLEALFPPIPSEPVLLAAGLASARGGPSPLAAVLAATLGTTVGATAWYSLARAVGQERLRTLVVRRGRWVGVRERDLDRVLAAFGRHRRTAVVTGRFLPVGRMAVSLPAGSLRMPLGEFLLATALGSAVWCGVVITLGRLLGQSAGFAAVQRYDRAVLVVLGVGLVGLAVALRRRAAR